jgi:hypothetical protein
MNGNRVHRALIRRSASAIDDVLNGIRTGSASPLRAEEIDEIVEFFKKSGLSSRFSPALWGLAWYSEADEKLLEICRAKLRNGREIADKEVWENHLDMMLSYILSKADPIERCQLINSFSKCDALRLRFVVAEYLVRTKEVERGLRMMMDLFFVVGSDHTVTNSIEMWFSEYGTKELKRKFLKEKAKADKSGDDELAKKLEWAVSMIFD